MKKIVTVFGLSLAMSLQGCFVVGAAAGAAAITVVYDHRTIANTVQDTHTATQIAERINKIPGFKDDSHLEVTVFNNIVLLTGETPNPNWRQQAGEIAQATPDVEKVYNSITVQGPTSSLTRTSDSWITTKIKGQMLATENLRSGSIKVVTQNGTVYLMGVVSQRQANTAVDIAKDVSGVQKVIKIFRYKS